MPRPIKGRKVCCLPRWKSFGPLDNRLEIDESIFMSVDEYETIRLIDLEKMTQEECASQMNVARTTVQRVYNNARKKLAEALVTGKMLEIQGGEYQLYGGTDRSCTTGCCKGLKKSGCPRYFQDEVNLLK